VHFIAQVFVEDKSQDIIPEVIGAHLATQGIGDVPELLFEVLFVIVGHII